MTLKRLALIALTVLSAALVGLQLYSSLTQPQIQSRLELYQTNLVLRAAGLPETAPEPAGDPGAIGDALPEDMTASALADRLRAELIGTDPFTTAKREYDDFRALVVESLTAGSTPVPGEPSLVEPAASRFQQVQTLAELDLRRGLLALEASSDEKAASEKKSSEKASSEDGSSEENASEATSSEATASDESPEAVQRDRLASAREIWAAIPAKASDLSPSQRDRVASLEENRLAPSRETAAALLALWADPPTVPPAAEAQLEANLEGWFRDRALARLYEVQGRSADLAEVREASAQAARQTVFKLAIANGIPAIGLLVGTGLLAFLGIQRFVQGENSALHLGSALRWTVPWGGETVLQVFVVGFFFAGQIVVPLVVPTAFGLAGLNPARFSGAAQAAYVCLTYGVLAAAGLTVLNRSVRPWQPLDRDWFRFDLAKPAWLLWGLGGYLVALPLVVGISLVNQQLWQGQGGSNPILSVVLASRDPAAIFFLFATAAVAAPLFEETLFRGFLLPSLTKYLPPWGAIATSALLFSVAHLSLSEVLPLTVLGVVLGAVYTRSRNLLASVLLHGLWNSGTLVSLLILGGGGV